MIPSPEPQPEPDPVNSEERRLFDGLFDDVMAEMPPQIRELLEEVPLIVEDYPSQDVLEAMDIEYIDELCGLHDGVPLTERGTGHSGVMPEAIYLFREGLLTLSMDDEGYVDEDELKKQIRITVLHEIGHHFGLEEDDLKKLGYA